MHILTDSSVHIDTSPNLAATYRAAHRNRLMLLTKLRDTLPARHEFCRILKVETGEPSLWITASFLDGSTKGMRPDKLRLATKEEEQFSNDLPS